MQHSSDSLSIPENLLAIREWARGVAGVGGHHAWEPGCGLQKKVSKKLKRTRKGRKNLPVMLQSPLGPWRHGWHSSNACHGMLQLLWDAQGKGPNLLRTLVMTSANTQALSFKPNIVSAGWLDSSWSNRPKSPWSVVSPKNVNFCQVWLIGFIPRSHTRVIGAGQFIAQSWQLALVVSFYGDIR